MSLWSWEMWTGTQPDKEFTLLCYFFTSAKSKHSFTVQLNSSPDRPPIPNPPLSLWQTPHRFPAESTLTAEAGLVARWWRCSDPCGSPSLEQALRDPLEELTDKEEKEERDNQRKEKKRAPQDLDDEWVRRHLSSLCHFNVSLFLEFALSLFNHLCLC